MRKISRAFIQPIPLYYLFVYVASLPLPFHSISDGIFPFDGVNKKAADADFWVKWKARKSIEWEGI
jgi:hypothetical protein